MRCKLALLDFVSRLRGFLAYSASTSALELLGAELVNQDLDARLVLVVAPADRDCRRA